MTGQDHDQSDGPSLKGSGSTVTEKRSFPAKAAEFMWGPDSTEVPGRRAGLATLALVASATVFYSRSDSSSAGYYCVALGHVVALVASGVTVPIAARATIKVHGLSQVLGSIAALGFTGVAIWQTGEGHARGSNVFMGIAAMVIAVAGSLWTAERTTAGLGDHWKPDCSKFDRFFGAALGWGALAAVISYGVAEAVLRYA